MIKNAQKVLAITKEAWNDGKPKESERDGEVQRAEDQPNSNEDAIGFVPVRDDNRGDSWSTDRREYPTGNVDCALKNNCIECKRKCEGTLIFQPFNHI